MTDRVSLRAAGAGAIVAAGVGVVLLVAGAAIAPGLVDPEAAAASYSLAAGALSALAGGWVAAAGSRTMTARDGRLQGALAGAMLVVAVAAFTTVDVALFGYRVDQAAGPPIAAVLASVLLGGLLGGSFGARSEARAIGVKRVRAPRLATRSYEREFFDAPLSAPSQPSLPPA